MTHTYKAYVSRDGWWWIISVPEVNGLTETHWKWAIRRNARDMIAVTEDVPSKSVDVELIFETEEDE